MEGSNRGASFHSEVKEAISSGRASRPMVPPDLTPPGCQTITAKMLSLVELEPRQIEQIGRAVPGGTGNIEDIYPLTPLQESVLFQYVLGKRDDCAVTALLESQSGSRMDALIRALQETIDCHEILRTSVLWEELPRPLHVINRQATLPVEEIALDPHRHPIEQLEEHMGTDRQTLDPRNAPLMHLQIAADTRTARRYALLRVHRLVCDAASLQVVIEEVLSRLEGRAQPVRELVPYRSHVAQALTNSQIHNAEAFFRGTLGTMAEFTAAFGLVDRRSPGDRIREAIHPLETGLAQKLRALARRIGVTAATLFHSACGLVVSRVSGQDDLVFGSAVSGQPRIGMLLNVLPLRLVLRNTSVNELTMQVQQRLSELSTYEHFPSSIAQRCSGNTGTLPLFTSMLVYRTGAVSFANGAAGIRVLARRAGDSYTITLSVDDSGDGFVLSAQTDHRIDPHRIVEYVQTATQSLVEALELAPQSLALSLSILPDSERRQLIDSFNDTRIAYPHEKLIHELFEEQVQRTPHAVAVEYAQQSLSYIELESRANQLARFLRSRGVGPDQLVALYVERGFAMVVGVLGILKAGGAYVPLDPAYPPERLTCMLEDTAPRVVLTQDALRAALPSTESEVIALDSQWPEIAAHAREKLAATELSLNARHLAYVIFTSGSTGRPKGTAMAHCSLVNLIEWHRRNLNPREPQRVLQFAALSFDVAFQEIFSTLCTGATLVLLDERTRRNPQLLTELLRSQSIQRLFVPPLALQSLAEYFKSSGAVPHSLRDVITAGEQLRISPEIADFFKQLRPCRVHNHYGPTETHVVTAQTLAEDPDQWPVLPTIGRPISNTQIYLLDADLRTVPLGVAGEIYIGGAGVARGYLRRPDLTSQRFIDDPFSVEPGARLYRTGDLGKYRTDGTLEYLGRNDQQVKIRGYRIELGDIEAQLARNAKVKEAAVVAREDMPGQKRLVAYVTPRGASGNGMGPSVEELRTYLKSVLPEYMVPSAFVTLESLPLTPNGKLDRHALPAPRFEAYARADYEAPQGEMERVLVEIWEQVLRVEQVGREDDFFELGGHSLSGMTLVERIAQRFTVQVPFHLIFLHPTIRQMAQFVGALLSDGQQRPAFNMMDLKEGVI